MTEIKLVQLNGVLRRLGKYYRGLWKLIKFVN